MSKAFAHFPPGKLLGVRFVARGRAPYATNPEDSRGRYWPEQESPNPDLLSAGPRSGDPLGRISAPKTQDPSIRAA